MRQMNLSTAFFRKGSMDEALQVLDEIHTENKKIIMLVDDQREFILTTDMTGKLSDRSS